MKNMDEVETIETNPLCISAYRRELDQLRAQLAEATRDAERYRWLREQRWSESSMCVVLHPKNAVRLGHECPSVDRLDAYIDAAIAAAKGEV